MDPAKKPAGDMLGHIPRKKKKLPLGGPAAPAASTPVPQAVGVPPVVRRKKPKMLQRARSQEMLGDGSERSGASSSHTLGAGSERSTTATTSHAPPKQFSRLKPYTGQSRRPSNASSNGGSGRSSSMPENSRISIISESPFVVKIKTRGLPQIGAIPSGSSFTSLEGRATAKRQRSGNVTSYKEPAELDADDIMTEAEEQALIKKRAKKRKKVGDDSAGGVDPLMSSLDVTAVTVESPPAGVLGTLWYSRECYLHVFVMEKICGWKTRPRVQLVCEAGAQPIPKMSVTEQQPGPETSVEAADQKPPAAAPQADDASHEDNAETKPPAVAPLLDNAQAVRLQQKAISSEKIWSDRKRRMEVSRINPTNCPIVMAMAAADSQSAVDAKNRYKVQAAACVTGAVANGNGVVSVQNGAREEVLLVKWRGRSYMHCSWERASDIQRLDPSANNTARNKIRRFYQNQESVHGLNWKNILEKERLAEAAIHLHAHKHPTAASSMEVVEEDQGEEYFSPQCVEVEAILACDENEMNMEVLAKQRALNIRSEELELNRKEQEERSLEEGKISSLGIDGLRPELKIDEPRTWDPEDNVRYVVKWKGLPYADISWEYWRDIKRDAVDQAEDFWYRQRPPDLEEVRRLASRPHPHMRDFQKLQESPAYGVSSKPRPIAKLEDNPMTIATDPGFRLRSYQLEGVNWLLFNWWNRRSCILADEMGLGKTIQSAAFLQELMTQPAAQVRGPFLIVAPLSLVGQWQSELASWAPDMNVILYHGSADARDFLAKQEFYYTDQFVPKPTAVKLKKSHVTKFTVLITTYEVALKDITVLSKIRWRTLIVDEAHRLKNHKSKLFEELASVPRDHCVLLTGTPIANATEELWALLHFANPRTFHDRESFLEKFGEMTDAKQVNELHALLKPYLLRRVKEDVEKSLPNKEETILEVQLTPTQKTFYKAIYERNTSFLFKGAKPNNAPSLMNVMMELRKCCNHPFLIKGVEDRILDEAAAKLPEMKNEQGHPLPANFTELFEEHLVKASGKMVLMEKLLQKLFSGGHKVLVFSQMVRVLDLLEELLKQKKYKYERLDGSTSSSSRLHAVERFKKKSCQRFVMLLSTRAGGLGLNLTAADIVIIFDSDWNPQNDMQAMARAHRIGQTRAVKVYRLLTAKTYEMHMFHSASLKLGLERAVLSQNREQNTESDEGSKLTRKGEREAQAKEIDELLKKGAYDVFRDEDDTAATAFMETDIDQLLEISSKKVTYGAAATSSLGSGLGSFSKASFVANTDEGEKDVDLDDPDFWSKAVGLDAPPEETPEDVAAMLDDGVKRSRKQVEQYDPYAETVVAEQLKKDRIALEKLLEKDERERLKEEKKLKKQKAKEEKRRKQREEKSKLKQLEREKNPGKPKKALPMGIGKTVKVPKLAKEAVMTRPKRSKKNNRTRVLRRAEDEDPVIEKFKQAWEIPQRNRATAAAIRFGFGRFCKLRSESNLSSLALQDLEVFFRSYTYQLSLQVAVALMARVGEEASATDIRVLFRQWLGFSFTREVDWLCDSIQTVIKFQAEVESGCRFLRIPLILAEPVYVSDLRHGAGFRALRRIGILARLNRFVEECLDSILHSLGHEELGKRGCGVNELTMLDADLKSRFVTTEELALAIGMHFKHLNLNAPASWWDRNCDVGLVIGTFVHGLSNYEVMRRDQGIPFGDKIRKVSDYDSMCRIASQRFRIAAGATRKVFDDALEAGRMKAELEVQAAVAAAKKAEAQRAEDAALLRKGGAEAADAVRNMPETQVEDAFVYDGTDSHFVTLARLHQNLQDAVLNHAIAGLGLTSFDEIQEAARSDEDAAEGPISSAREKEPHDLLPMPDSRVLDYRLLRVLDELEKSAYGSIDENDHSELNLWLKSTDVLANLRVRDKWLSAFCDRPSDIVDEYAGVGLGASQCAISHRTLNDGSDYSFGSASSQLSQLAYGTDAPRYLRALGVPMNVTRFAISGLIYADSSCVDELMHAEQLRYFGRGAKGEFRSETAETEGQKPPTNGSVDLSSIKSNGDIAASGDLNNPEKESPVQSEGTMVAADSSLGQETRPGEAEREGIFDAAPNETENEVSTVAIAQGATTPPTETEGVDPAAQEHTNPSAKESLCKATPENGSAVAGPPSQGAALQEPGAESHAPSNLDVVKPVDPVELIPVAFRTNACLRAHVCLAAIHFGFPPPLKGAPEVNADLWTILLNNNGSTQHSAPETLFDVSKFRNAVVGMAPDVEVPDVRTLQQYMERILLPHCLRLCVSGNGPSTRNARGSKGNYETAFGISIHPETSQPHPSPLPDPCVSLQEHSLEALGVANALLRRVQLLRACIHICSQEAQVPSNTILSITKATFMGKLQDMPIWWCPWIHDSALLFQAATCGLFSIVADRSEHSIFSPRAIQQFLYVTLVANNRGLPAMRNAPPEEVASWTEQEAKKFPSLNQLERRLGALCSQATTELQSQSDSIPMFHSIPMFDHGGWPRN